MVMEESKDEKYANLLLLPNELEGNSRGDGQTGAGLQSPIGVQKSIRSPVESMTLPSSKVSPIAPAPVKEMADIPPSISLLSRIHRWDAKWLILPKLIYFFLNCAVYATHNYTAMYFYRMWNIEIYQFGAVSSLSAVHFLGSMLWGMLADRTGRHKTILLLCTVLYAIFFCLLQIKPFEGQTQLAGRIAYSAAMYGLSCFFVAGLFPLVDAQVFSILSHDPKFSKEVFGRQRLWGTLGHGGVTLAVGCAIQLMGYAGMFLVLLASCAAFMALVIIAIPADVKIIKSARKGHGHGKDAYNNNKKVEADVSDSHTIDIVETGGKATGCMSNPILALLLNPHFAFLALVILTAGFVRSVMSSFLAFYMQQEMKQSEIMIAIAIMFRMTSEIVVYFYNKQLIRILGLHWMLIFAQVAGLVRVLAYSLLPPEGNWFYLSFAIELLKGASGGCLMSAAARMASDIAPIECANTAQAYISGIYGGLSLAIGGALGGLIIYWLPDHSVAAMFRITFYIGLSTLAGCFIKYALIDRVILVRRRRNNNHISSESQQQH